MSSSQFRKEFNDLRHNNMVYRFSTELQHSNDRMDIKTIRDIINKLQLPQVDADSKENKMKKYLETIDMIQYSKAWKRLKSFQQENRLGKFIEEHKIPKVTGENLFDLLENGKLTHHIVSYNVPSGEIVSIDCLHKTLDGGYELVDIDAKTASKSKVANKESAKSQVDVKTKESAKSKVDVKTKDTTMSHIFNKANISNKVVKIKKNKNKN